jgi:hypothetical protein
MLTSMPTIADGVPKNIVGLPKCAERLPTGADALPKAPARVPKEIGALPTPSVGMEMSADRSAKPGEQLETLFFNKNPTCYECKTGKPFQYKMKKLYPYIDSVMENCEWIIILLEDEDSPTVTYEIKKAIKEKDHDNIIILVKETRACKEKSIKFLPYSDLSDLEVTLIRAINKRMKEICEKKKIEIFV